MNEHFDQTELCDRLMAMMQEQGYSCRMDTINKLGRSYDGLVASKKDGKASVSFDLEDLYREFREGKSLERLVKEMGERLDSLPSFTVHDLRDYEKVKGRLFVRLNNTEASAAYLKNVPHKEQGEFSITCHIRMDSGVAEGTFAATIVTKDMLEDYGISTEQLLEDALENGQKILPAVVEDGFELLRSAGYNKNGSGSTARSLILTTPIHLYGAAAVLYPGMLEKIGEKIGEDYYAIPSSIHEWMMIPVSMADAEVLKQRIRAINKGFADTGENLSDDLYRYYRVIAELVKL